MSIPDKGSTGYGTGVLVTLAALAALLLIAVAVLVGVVTLRGDDATPIASSTSTPTVTDDDGEAAGGDDVPEPDEPTPGGRVPPATESDEDSGPPASTGPKGPKPVRVFGTLGKNWKADEPGDGWIAVRTKPGKNGKRVGRLAEGETVIVECASKGITYTSSLFDITSNVWARTSDGHYVAAIYLQDANENLMHVKGALGRCAS